MMNTEAMKKYFNYKHKYLTDYLENNNFYVDKDSTLEAGHSTQKALVAMFNPDYYDNFYKKHLEESEEWYINNKKKLLQVKYRKYVQNILRNTKIRL